MGFGVWGVRTKSLLDIFLVNFPDKILNKKQFKIPHQISKHEFIAIKYEIDNDILLKSGFWFRNINIINITDLLSFASDLDLDFIYNIFEVDEIVSVLNQYFKYLLDLFAPVKFITFRKKRKFPFMNSTVVKAAKRRRDIAYDEYIEDVIKLPENGKNIVF